MNDGGQAFPLSSEGIRQAPNGTMCFGMTLRAYFAGQAMAAYRNTPEGFSAADEDVAKWACGDADALIAELAKETT